MSYTPTDEILDKYASVLVNFALGSGAGMKPGEVVFLQSPLSALPLYNALKRAIIKTDGHIISNLSDDTSGMSRYFYKHASQKQLTKFLDKYFKGLADQIDHRIAVLADFDIHELDGVDPRKIMLAQKTVKPLNDWLDKKEGAGKYTWTLGLYGTKSMAREAGLSTKEYWEQIIHACYLDYDDPISEWHRISKEINRVSRRLSQLNIDSLDVKGVDVDLHIHLGDNRRWLGGSGRNIPSFEVFTSPDWRGTEGWIKFNQPLYRYGSVVKDIELHFRKGRVVKATAKRNEDMLKEMLGTDTGAAQVGEFSLTDRRLSRITKFMAQTLFDENMGGKYGNTHIAVGKSYRDTLAGNAGKTSDATFKKLGFNESAIHTDMISTSNRTVTANLKSGRRTTIYQNGEFTV